ncbi:MAG: phosphoglucomutase/phosphomannomutase family protein [Bdellovibrionota bacterium]
MKKNPVLKFGTDGWRGIIAQDYTFENVSYVSHAVAKVCKEKYPDRNTLYIGHDRRFLSKAFAKHCACIFATQGFHVLLTPDYLPTPILSWTTKKDSTSVGAVVITASHNPPTWNGFKFKEIFGGSAFKETTDEFEKALDFSIEPKLFDEKEFEQLVANQSIEFFDVKEAYIHDVLSLVDTDLIRKAKFSVGIDPMHGSGSVVLADILKSIGVNVHEIHADENPSFGGRNPEPIEQNLKDLQKLVKEKNLDAGLATDGDADRLGAIDEHGGSFSTQMILSSVYWHMLKHRKKSWNISRSVSTTKMVDLIAKQYGQECFETPVGFKNIARNMVEGRAQIGGEEAGGIGFDGHIPERDSIATALMLLEMMATTGKKLKACYDQICQEIRPYQFVRLDVTADQTKMQHALLRLKQDPPSQWNGREVETLQTIDGLKFYLKDGSWVLVRPSGTEPIFRLYAEAESQEAAEKLVEHVRDFVLS